MPCPYDAVYAATKAYVLSFSNGLYQELKGTGVTVTCLCPGATQTLFAEKANINDTLLFKFFVMQPEVVAAIGYNNLQKGKRVVTAGLYNKLLVLSAKLLPVSIINPIAEIYFKTPTLTLPFALSFLDNAVPSNYELPVTASVSCGSTTITAEPNIYKPKYKDWAIDKFVNSNRLDTFKKDGAEVIVTAQEEGDDPYLDDRTYVNFAFRVNSVNGPGRGLDDYRDITSATLADTLPAYIDKDGNARIAVFDQEANPGWTASEDGKTVTKIYTGTDCSDVLYQIYDDAPLKLRLSDIFSVNRSFSVFLLHHLLAM